MDITRGSNTTLKSQTLEARLLEGFQYLTTKIAEVSEVTVNWDISIVSSTATISYQLPAAHSNTDGTVKLWGVDVLADSDFKPGDNGQFVSDNLIGQLVEMIYLGQTAETAQSTPESANRISANHDSDEQYISGTVILPIEITRSDSNGTLNIKAKKFLN